MAIGAATLDLNSNNYNTLRYTTAAAALADNDTALFGLFGDAGATLAAAPAGWAGNGTGTAGATGQSETLTDAQRTARCLCWVNFLTDPTAAGANPFFWVLSKTAAPWRYSINYQGDATAAGTTLEIFIHWLWSAIR